MKAIEYIEELIEEYNYTYSYGIFVLKNGMSINIPINFETMNEQWLDYKKMSEIGGKKFKNFIKKENGHYVTNGQIFLDPTSIDFSIATYLGEE